MIEEWFDSLWFDNMIEQLDEVSYKWDQPFSTYRCICGVYVRADRCGNHYRLFHRLREAYTSVYWCDKPPGDEIHHGVA